MRRRLSPLGLILVLAACLALQMTSFVMILPLFARRFEAFGAGVEALAASTLAYALAATLAAPLLGALADRIGRRPVVVLSLAAYALAFLGYRLARSAVVFIVVRGLAWGRVLLGWLVLPVGLALWALADWRQGSLPRWSAVLFFVALPIGRLVVAPRAPGAAFSPADRRLLSDLARQAAPAVHA